jgi:hypothetical protein
MKKVLVIFAILVVSAIVGACGGGTAGSSTTVRENVSNPAPAKAGTDQASAGGGTAYGPTSTLPIAQGPKVIRQAQLAISVKSGAFDTTLTQVRGLVQLQGGFISGTDAQANPTTNESIRTGVVSFMVPADKFDDTIDQLSKMGRVQNEHISGQDVSAQYVDLKARLANAQAQRDAMIALLRKAQSVQDIIAVQAQLGQITEQIEQLKGQISYLDHNTTYSSISVSIAEVGAPAQTRSVDQWGFVTALGDSAHNFVTTINYILTGLGAIGPILILLGLGYLLWRRSGRPGLKHA